MPKPRPASLQARRRVHPMAGPGEKEPPKTGTRLLFGGVVEKARTATKFLFGRPPRPTPGRTQYGTMALALMPEKERRAFLEDKQWADTTRNEKRELKHSGRIEHLNRARALESTGQFQEALYYFGLGGEVGAIQRILKRFAKSERELYIGHRLTRHARLLATAALGLRYNDVLSMNTKRKIFNRMIDKVRRIGQQAALSSVQRGADKRLILDAAEIFAELAVCFRPDSKEPMTADPTIKPIGSPDDYGQWLRQSVGLLEQVVRLGMREKAAEICASKLGISPSLIKGW